MESTRRHWVLPLLLVAVLAGVLAARALRSTTTRVDSIASNEDDGANQERVELTIDVGDGAPRALTATWRAGMTVQDALALSNIRYFVQGRGEAAFLTELAGVKNEGAGGRNWQFEVNQKWSDRGFGVHVLKPGDHVLWNFAESE